MCWSFPLCKFSLEWFGRAGLVQNISQFIQESCCEDTHGWESFSYSLCIRSFSVGCRPSWRNVFTSFVYHLSPQWGLKVAYIGLASCSCGVGYTECVWLTQSESEPIWGRRDSSPESREIVHEIIVLIMAWGGKKYGGIKGKHILQHHILLLLIEISL